MSGIKKFEVWSFYSSENVVEPNFESGLKKRLSVLLSYELKEFLLGYFEFARFKGSINIEPEWDDFFKEYLYTTNAVYRAIEKKGIDPYNGDLPCLNEEECKEFTNAIELADFLKEEIDKYQPTKEENELIEYIEFLKEECQSFEFVNCDEIKQKEFKNDKERKEFLKEMIDKYVKFYRRKAK